MDALTALTTRVSPIKLGEPAPPAAAIEAMLAAAVSAPDHGRLKPWRFLLIEGDARGRFGELMAQSLLRREPGASPDRLDAERKKALRAPLVIVAAAALAESPNVPQVEQIVAVGAAVQNLLVAAHALGYGGFWRTGPAAYDAALKGALGLAESDAIVGFLYLGSVAAAAPAREIESGKTVSRMAGAG